MSIETGLRTKLINNTDVNALVGTRVFPMRLPQGYTLPAISYQRIDAPREPELSEITGWVRSRFQFDAWAESYSEVRDLANKLRIAINGFRGDLSGTHVGGIMIDSERDLFEESTEEYRVTLDFIIPYVENI